MLLPRSTFASALCALVLLQQPTSVNGDFAGSYTRSSISPSICVAPTICDYQCSAAYTITVTGSTATIYPTSNSSCCACETLTASIVGDSALGKGSASTYSLKRTTDGIDVIASVSGFTCIGSYITSTALTTTPSTDCTTTRSPSSRRYEDMSPSTARSTTTPSPSPSPTTASSSGSVSTHLGLLGVTIAASTALALSHL